jgi:hypothetical protein
MQEEICLKVVYGTEEDPWILFMELRKTSESFYGTEEDLWIFFMELRKTPEYFLWNWGRPLNLVYGTEEDLWIFFMELRKTSESFLWNWGRPLNLFYGTEEDLWLFFMELRKTSEIKDVRLASSVQRPSKESLSCEIRGIACVLQPEYKRFIKNLVSFPLLYETQYRRWRGGCFSLKQNTDMSALEWSVYVTQLAFGI